MKYFSIIADDLTGASDTAVKFCRDGYKVKVIIDHKDLNNNIKRNNILSVNSDTRECSRDTAYSTVFSIAKELREKNYNNIYKKIDSVLRGNVGAEIDAVMDALKSDLALVVPAIPALGRTIIDGYLNIASCTEKKNVKQIIEETSNKRVEIIKLDEVRKSKDEIFSLINELYKAGVNIISFDTETEDDLRKLSEAFKMVSQNAILVGSSGIAEYLSSIWSNFEEEQEKTTMNLTLLVSGSYNKINYEQMEYISKNENAFIIYLDIDNIILKPNYEIEKMFEHLEKGLKTKSNISLIGIGVLDKHKEPNIKDSSYIMNFLGLLSKRLIQTYKFNSIIATGGQTALHLFKCLGAKEISLLDEIVTGIPVGRLIGGECDEMIAATKSGGFGEPEVFETILEYFRLVQKIRSI
ncbi:MAG: four-carbon acid sugar kinase family protein [Lutisporaceae bacterium]